MPEEDSIMRKSEVKSMHHSRGKNLQNNLILMFSLFEYVFPHW